MTTVEPEKIERIIDKYGGDEGSLIQILLDIQQEYNWIPPEAAKLVGERIDIPITQIYRVASFYKSLSLSPRGKYLVKVCMGTACHVRGGGRVMDKLIKNLGIKAGETTEDMKFTLEKVNCLGCCALGPMVTVGSEYHGKMAPMKVAEVLSNYE